MHQEHLTKTTLQHGSAPTTMNGKSFNVMSLEVHAAVSSWCDSVSTLCIVVCDVSQGFHSHVPAVVLRQFRSQLRYFRVVFAATCPVAALHVNLCSTPRGHQGVLGVPPLVPHINLRLRVHSAWGRPVPAVGSRLRCSPR